MSLHAQLSPEAIARLHAQQRNSTISSILISILVVVLAGIVLLYILLPQIESFTPEIVSYQTGQQDKEIIEKREIARAVQRQPSAPSSSMAKVIAANVASPVAIPVPDTVVDSPSLELGNGDDFGDGWGDGWGVAGGSGGGFGSTSKLDGTITGHLYDFKQSPEGEALSDYNIQNRAHFTDRINRLHRSRYSDLSLDRYFRTKQPLYVRYIAIPFSNASDGPRFFNAEKEVKPSGWIAHYHGQVVAPKNGTFRFAGAGDDYLSVTVNKKFRLVAAWSDIMDTVAVRGANATQHPNHRSPIGTAPLTYGDWFTVRKGQVLDLSITLGERPGGKVGFVLMLEEKGVDYRTTSSGQPVLPPFSMGPLSPQDVADLKKFPGWEWETENVPVFLAK
ncbi:hypothetical protein NT6N_23120 [Oceaniferula spumae]|uniref:PA14 domain-containing protein n=1 Tax=Oceaniferula spumae TaxID=2979115 RepID=A0AAT9FMS6_9BACT